MDMGINEKDSKQFIILRVSSGVEIPYYYVDVGDQIAFIRIIYESVTSGAIDLKRLIL